MAHQSDYLFLENQMRNLHIQETHVFVNPYGVPGKSCVDGAYHWKWYSKESIPVAVLEAAAHGRSLFYHEKTILRNQVPFLGWVIFSMNPQCG